MWFKNLQHGNVQLILISLKAVYWCGFNIKPRVWWTLWWSEWLVVVESRWCGVFRDCQTLIFSWNDRKIVLDICTVSLYPLIPLVYNPIMKEKRRGFLTHQSFPSHFPRCQREKSSFFTIDSESHEKYCKHFCLHGRGPDIASLFFPPGNPKTISSSRQFRDSFGSNNIYSKWSNNNCCTR